MKVLKVSFLALAILSALPAFAQVSAVKCTAISSDTYLILTMKQSSDGSYKTEVTTESTGGSYPTFHFKNIQLLPEASDRIGAPVIYKGPGFKLTIAVAMQNQPAFLSVPSLGIEHEKLTCNRYSSGI